MVINKVLDEIFSRYSNISVLRALNKYGVGISGREVARSAGITVKNCFNALNDLEDIGIITRVRGGRDHLFSLNRERHLVKQGIIPLLEMETRFIEVIFKDIKKKLKNKCNSVYLFGSVSRKEESVGSDFDVCIIYDKKNQRKLLEESVSELQSYLYKRYFINVAPIYFLTSTFVRLAINNKPPVTGIIKEGRLIFGKSIRDILNAG